MQDRVTHKRGGPEKSGVSRRDFLKGSSAAVTATAIAAQTADALAKENEKNEVVARLGDDVARVTAKDGREIRGDSAKWIDGKFVHPHDACFDREGNLFVAEWVGTGRISKLTRV